MSAATKAAEESGDRERAKDIPDSPPLSAGIFLGTSQTSRGEWDDDISAAGDG